MTSEYECSQISERNWQKLTRSSSKSSIWPRWANSTIDKMNIEEAIPRIHRLIPKPRYSIHKGKIKQQIKLFKYYKTKTDQNIEWSENDITPASQVLLTKHYSHSNIDVNDKTKDLHSRNISFGNPNFDYLIDLYNTDANKQIMAKYKPLVLNNQLFSKRSKMVNTNLHTKQNKAGRRKNKSMRSSLNWSKSLKSLKGKHINLNQSNLKQIIVSVHFKQNLLTIICICYFMNLRYCKISLVIFIRDWSHQVFKGQILINQNQNTQINH